MPHSWRNDAHATDHRIALSQEWDDLVEQARRIPGFGDFLKPPNLDTLLPAARGGPVVIVNVSKWRCDALIVRESGVVPCRLPKLVADDAEARTSHYLATLQAAETAAEQADAARKQRRDRGTVSDRQAVQQAERRLAATTAAIESMLADLLAWLWDAITEPVLRTLGYLDTPTGNTATWPRIWWCPTGPLTLLPLHAAGYHGDPPSGPPRTVMDRVVSSYTPTLRALLEARKPLDASLSETDRLLVVGLANAPGQRPLAGVDMELQVLTELIPPQRRTVLRDSDATRDAVWSQLRTHRWVHFSCHGDQELDDPSRGGLALHDGILTVADITTGHYHAEFAGLSACKTATGGVNLLDEAITLAAALHYTGYRHVIGTLWSVYDSAGTIDLFATIYRDMATSGRLHPERSAHALHRATRALRDAHPDRPTTWTPFTHTGP